MLGRVSSTDYADYTDASGAGGVAADAGHEARNHKPDPLETGLRFRASCPAIARASRALAPLQSRSLDSPLVVLEPL
ncbi:MAG TPA: hypothetical protein VL882_03335 [Vicinamibacterales bacterium]|nr:hypothetical protein [Vicinamibacterales bacterium]